jgi:hypothetical protein
MNKIKMINPYVLIIGSGFHKQAFGKGVENSLTSWDILLESIDCKSNQNSNYILDFEMHLTQETGKQNEKNAQDTEKNILQKISSSIIKEQEKAILNKKVKYPIEIFNPSKVSDVISLNFDLVPELILQNAKLPRVKYCSQKSNINGKPVSKNINNTRHRILKSTSNGSITFWHPHGDIKDPKSLQLGIRKYGKAIDEVETLRKRFKKNELKSTKDDSSYKPSWYDKIINQPVIVIGASLSDNEWDIWFALVNKMRNFAKKGNKKFENPIYILNCSKDKYNEQLFTEILPNSKDCSKKWQAIKELLE